MLLSTLETYLQSLGAPTIPSSLSIPKGHTVIFKGGKPLVAAFEQRFMRFVEEFEWYIEALKNQRVRVHHINIFCQL